MRDFVWARVVWASVDLVARAGLPVEPLFEGLAFDAKTVRSMDRVSWDDYCAIVEAVERVAGGPDACAALLATSYHQVIPEVRHVAGALASPKQLLRFTTEVMMRVLTPPVYGRIVDRGRDDVRVDVHIAPGARPCAAYLRGSRGAIAGMPCHLGLAPADVEAHVHESGREATYFVKLPPSRTVASRVGRRVKRFVSWVTLGVDDGGEISMALSYSPSGEPPDDASHGEEPLTAKQRAVLTQVTAGFSNKEIATSLGCAENTVEYHVTTLLKRFGVRSRAELLAKVLAKSRRGPPDAPSQ